MNYVSLEVMLYAVKLMQERIVCEHQSKPGIPTLDCQQSPEYLVPDATRVSMGGDIERKPMFFCREHTAEVIGEEPQEQPNFKRITNPSQ